MITNSDKTHIRHILSDPAWQAVESLRKDLIEKIKDEQVVKDSQWDTTVALLTNQGKIAGINQFINELFNTQL